MSVKSSVPEAAGCSEPVHVWTDPAAVLVMYSLAWQEGQAAIGVVHKLEIFVQPFSNKESHREGRGNSLQL